VRAIIVAAVLGLWATLYDSLPAYPPTLGPSLAAVAFLFLTALILIRRRQRDDWPGLAQVGLVVSAVGLVFWIAGGVLNALDVSVTEFVAHLQVGWGELIKQLIGERTGGLTVFVAFGFLWLTVAALLPRAAR
jgi:hypothetical protein